MQIWECCFFEYWACVTVWNWNLTWIYTIMAMEIFCMCIDRTTRTCRIVVSQWSCIIRTLLSLVSLGTFFQDYLLLSMKRLASHSHVHLCFWRDTTSSHYLLVSEWSNCLVFVISPKVSIPLRHCLPTTILIVLGAYDGLDLNYRNCI